MKALRSLLMLVVMAIAVLTVGCSSAPKVQGPLYSAEELAQIGQATLAVEEMQDRLLGIPPLVQKQDWDDVSNYIRGPLGEMRQRMSRLARQLKPDSLQRDAQQVARDVFGHLNEIDQATKDRDSAKAFKNYNEAQRDFNAFLELIPQPEGESI